MADERIAMRSSTRIEAESGDLRRKRTQAPSAMRGGTETRSEDPRRQTEGQDRDAMSGGSEHGHEGYQPRRGRRNGAHGSISLDGSLSAGCRSIDPLKPALSRVYSLAERLLHFHFGSLSRAVLKGDEV